MTTKQLHDYHSKRPFQPFYIVMADGSRYLIDHPELLAYSPTSNGRVCGIWMDEAEAFRTLDLLLMTALEPAPRDKKPRRKAS
jgi:hypothetical protein